MWMKFGGEGVESGTLRVGRVRRLATKVFLSLFQFGDVLDVPLVQQTVGVVVGCFPGVQVVRGVRDDRRGQRFRIRWTHAQGVVSGTQTGHRGNWLLTEHGRVLGAVAISVQTLFLEKKKCPNIFFLCVCVRVCVSWGSVVEHGLDEFVQPRSGLAVAACTGGVLLLS